MFYTLPEAELPIPVTIAPHGERAWNWFELGLQMTYFFSTLRVETDEGESFTRQFWFSQIEPILDIVRQANAQFQLIRVDIFSPGYVNGTDAYRLDRLHKVWRDRSGMTFKFLLNDGSTLVQNLSAEDINDIDLALILAI